MKSAVISGIILAALFIFVGINTVIVDNMLDDTIEAVDSLSFSDTLSEDFKALSYTYEKNAKYIEVKFDNINMLVMHGVQQIFVWRFKVPLMV